MDLYDFNCNPLYNKQFDAIEDNGAGFGFSRRCMKLAPTRDEDIYISEVILRADVTVRRWTKTLELILINLHTIHIRDQPVSNIRN